MTASTRRRVRSEIGRSAPSRVEAPSISCARRSGSELVTGQPAQAPIIEHVRPHTSVERDRRLVPIEDRPLHAAALPALGNPGNVGKQLLADALSAPLGDDEEIFEVETMSAEECR